MMPPRHWYWLLRYRIRELWNTYVLRLPRWVEEQHDYRNNVAMSKGIVVDTEKMRHGETQTHA